VSVKSALVEVEEAKRSVLEAERKLRRAVRRARKTKTWQEIADEIGTTRQNAQQRFGSKNGPAVS
jgi:hypothetical protein